MHLQKCSRSLYDMDRIWEEDQLQGPFPQDYSSKSLFLRLGHSQYSPAIWSTRWRTSVLHVKNTWRKSRGRMRTILRTILQRAIRKNAATRDATDEAVQNQVTRDQETIAAAKPNHQTVRSLSSHDVQCERQKAMRLILERHVSFS
ncbi:hypothetical protein UPYG_G00103320 [Umbra pygmaea]|uniref:Uncharacterized protein n=1 Tax=Umbra pygmaea TaxID=75934 RepID=A0ABD0X1B4_UMBPY